MHGWRQIICWSKNDIILLEFCVILLYCEEDYNYPVKIYNDEGLTDIMMNTGSFSPGKMGIQAVVHGGLVFMLRQTVLNMTAEDNIKAEIN